MKKYYLLLILILGLYFLDLDNNEPPIKVKKEEQNITKEENKIEIITLYTSSLPIEIEENKTEQQQEEKELKYCLDEIEDFNRRGEKERIFYEYDDNEVEIKVDKNSDGTIDFTNHREFTENGDLLLEEKDFDNNGEINTKTDYLYDSGDRLEEVEVKAYMSNREEPIVLKVDINYSDEEDIDDSKEGRKDIYQLLKSYTHSMVLDMNIDIEYHEEYDDEGRKVFAYLGSKEDMGRFFRYAYDDENLLSKTLIDYGYGRRNSTTYYTPSGQIKEVYVQDNEELKALEEERKRWYQEKLSKFKEEYRKIVEEGIYLESLKISNKLLQNKTFHQKLTKAYRYNEDGTIAEEFDGNEQNITYKYDTHRNLIEKRRGDEVLLKQKFKVCDVSEQ